jgi:hypothetical protein
MSPGTHGGAQPRADAAQQLVADVVPERVVELLELIEVDHEQRARAPVGDGALGLGGERAPVGQPGEVVGERQPARDRERGRLAQQQRHAHHDRQQREDGEPDGDGVQAHVWP